MQIPGLPEYGYARGICLQQGYDVCILFDGDILSLRAAESDQLRIFELKVLRLLKKLHILRVGARISGFDIAYAESVQRLHDEELIGYRKRDSFRLRSVPKGCIKYLQAFHWVPPFLEVY
ncbi:hypothetical protein SDC9_201916 [bioreactor metagenome]|uniref:Uncharacterized protein n=1 Tax=bioreactor metagenome TaxID=1076179 RepID=A0A645ISZ2_9ZZZZ